MTILEKQWSLCNKTYVTKKISCKLFISPQLFKEWGYILQKSCAECVPSSSVTRKKELCITNKQIPLKKKKQRKKI